MEEFEDQIFINKIREKLFSSKGHGNAAIMVGSGFSRNSSLQGDKDKKFPLWKDLSNRFIKELNRRNQNYSANTKSSLKLASEFEASFGRQELEQIIEDEIPDKLYKPSELHKLLLRLPWSDVFTTNYDTLLERASKQINEANYEIIYTPQDIPDKNKPRIIKLHGSLPSTRPYIITEEDYRTYQYNYAPFVNTVQQSLMENALCLIGFSGEDPNFLEWTGWVRDNLGNSKIPIYLCGVLELQNSERELLLDKNIRPIDLAPLFPSNKYLEEELRHFKAMKWFLLSLYLNTPPRKIDWPHLKSKSYNGRKLT